MVKEILVDLRGKGTAIIMSTHQMRQVEELCDRILLIDHGSPLLHGELDSFRSQYAGNSILVSTKETLPYVAGVTEIESHNTVLRLTLSPGTRPQEILQELIDSGIHVERFEIAIPTLDEIFIQVIHERGKNT
jgi:ABC-2 type transport system ATP-binding protein